MPTVYIPAQLRSLTNGHATVDVPGSTVGELIEQLEQQFPGIRARLCQDDHLMPGLQVSIDHRFTRQGLAAVVQPASEVHFLPAIGGG
jgi:molybdopterin synthase sulfur carrier subunit